MNTTVELSDGVFLPGPQTDPRTERCVYYGTVITAEFNNSVIDRLMDVAIELDRSHKPCLRFVGRR